MSYSLISILLFTNMDISITKMYLNKSILAYISEEYYESEGVYLLD
jgi:hypothetical protein